MNMLKQAKPKILVVDDEEGLRHVVETFLLREGYDVDTAGSYKESLGKLSCMQSVKPLVTACLSKPLSFEELLKHVKCSIKGRLIET